MRVRLICLTTFVITGHAMAQSLADAVPADSVAYVGWRGTADPGPGFAGSRWEAVLKDSQVGRLVDETIPAAGAVAERKYPRYGPTWHALASAVRQVIRRPSAAFLAFDGEKPRGGFLCRAGTGAKELTQSLQQFAALIPPMLQPRVITPGDAVGLVLGYDADTAVEGGLADNADFKAGLAQCVPEPSFVSFVNVKAALDLAGQAVDRHAPAEQAARFHRFVDASGLGGITGYTAAAGFVGKDWQTDAFVAAAAPRKGLLDLPANEPIDADLLHRVPASATGVTVFRLNPGVALKTVRDVAAEVDPAAGDLIDKAVGGAKLAVGKNIETDLLALLGNQWAVYNAPEIGGTSGAGVIVVNKLTNPAKAKQALAAVAIFLSNSAKNVMPNKDVTADGRVSRVGDVSVFYTATPVLSPAYAVRDGYLYLGLFPQTVVDAARYAGAAIDTNAGFVEATKPVDGHVPLVVSYTDVKATLGDGYALALVGSRTVLGMSDLFLAATPEPVLPPLGALYASATPAGSVVWGDDAGLHVRTRSPYPGAETLANLSITNLYIGNAPVMASILLPSLYRAREAANRVKSASNLRQIGLATVLYANDHRGALPQDAAEILQTQDVTVDVFVNPRTGTDRPVVPAGANPVEFNAQWAVEPGDYVYLGGGKMDDRQSADHVLAYEKPSGLSDGINVLFRDGHVEFVAFSAVGEIFAKSDLPSLVP